MHRLNTFSSFFLALLLGGASAFAQPAAPLYTVHDLGAPRGYGFVNNGGQVAGTYLPDPMLAAYHAFRTAPNSALNPAADDLGTLGGYEAVARAINGSGQVAGYSRTATFYPHGFRTAPNAAINPATDDIGTLGGTATYAQAINDLGQVVGQSQTSSGAYHAFRTAPNSPINPATDDLGIVTQDTPYQTWSINSAGDVRGVKRTGLPFVYQNGAVTDLTTFNWFTGINDHGQVAGSNYSGFLLLWQNGTVTDLGQCSCYPYAINNSTQIVGYFSNPPNHGFLYTNGAVLDLNNLIVPPPSGFVLGTGYSINDRGQIVAFGLVDTGEQHLFRLDPVTQVTTPTTSDRRSRE